jgi:hypothetical protein
MVYNIDAFWQSFDRGGIWPHQLSVYGVDVAWDGKQVAVGLHQGVRYVRCVVERAANLFAINKEVECLRLGV